MDIEAIKIDTVEFSHSGASHEEIIKFLRAEGCSKSQSIFVLSSVLGIDLSKAKTAVHFSNAWSDRRVIDEQFEANILDSISSLNEED